MTKSSVMLFIMNYGLNIEKSISCGFLDQPNVMITSLSQAFRPSTIGIDLGSKSTPCIDNLITLSSFFLEVLFWCWLILKCLFSLAI